MIDLPSQRITVTGLMFFIASVFFRTMLDISYMFFVSRVYGYKGFAYDPLAGSYLFSWFFFFWAMTFISPRLERISDFFFAMALLLVIAPLTSLYGLSGRGAFPVLITIGSINIMYLLTRPGLFKVPVFPVIIGGRKFAALISVAMVLYLVTWYFGSGAVRFFNLDFSRVYESRTASAELANIGVLAYLNNWVYKIFSMFLLAWLLYKRNFMLALLVVGAQVFFYGVSAHKSVLFLPAMILGVWFYFRRTNRLDSMPVLLSMVVSTALFLYLAFDQTMPASMFIRRVFYTPALLTYDYFSFFSENAHVFWSNSILAGLQNYPYDKAVPYMIGEYNGSGSHANIGFIANGYAHAGLPGVLVYSIIFALILRFIDVTGRYMPAWFGLALTIIPLRVALLSSDLFTVMSTHGMLIALLLLIFVRNPLQNKKCLPALCQGADLSSATPGSKKENICV